MRAARGPHHRRRSLLAASASHELQEEKKANEGEPGQVGALFFFGQGAAKCHRCKEQPSGNDGLGLKERKKEQEKNDKDRRREKIAVPEQDAERKGWGDASFLTPVQRSALEIYMPLSARLVLAQERLLRNDFPSVSTRQGGLSACPLFPWGKTVP